MARKKDNSICIQTICQDGIPGSGYILSVANETYKPVSFSLVRPDFVPNTEAQTGVTSLASNSGVAAPSVETYRLRLANILATCR